MESTTRPVTQHFKVIGENKDTGVRFLVCKVKTLAEAKAIVADYQQRFPNDTYDYFHGLDT